MTSKFEKDLKVIVKFADALEQYSNMPKNTRHILVNKSYLLPSDVRNTLYSKISLFIKSHLYEFCDETFDIMEQYVSMLVTSFNVKNDTYYRSVLLLQLIGTIKKYYVPKASVIDKNEQHIEKELFIAQTYIEAVIPLLYDRDNNKELALVILRDRPVIGEDLIKLWNDYKSYLTYSHIKRFIAICDAFISTYTRKSHYLSAMRTISEALTRVKKDIEFEQACIRG